MKLENEEVLHKKTGRIPDVFHRVLKAGARFVTNIGPGCRRAPVPPLAAALLLSGVLLLAGTPAPARAAGAEAVSAPTATLPAPVVITLGNRTLSGALASQGISQSMIAAIAHSLGEILNLRRLQPRDVLALYHGPDGDLTKLVYRQGPLEVYEVSRGECGWVSSRCEVPVDRRITLVAGTLEDNLFESIERQGESPRLVLDFAGIFAWVFDFAADSRPGDRFRMLVEKLYVKDRFVGYGRILAAEYESESALHTAVYFQEKERGDYYTPEGESLRRAFLKSPLDFARISSKYRSNRHHPILGGVRPHLAVDYAAPVGTPVWAVADGTVRFAGWKNGYGKTVSVRHKANYETLYSHLSRFGKGIRKGTAVKQRQVIGYVGSTGLCTGPHLDYRVIKDGRLVNPLKQTFLPGDPISPSSRPAFAVVRDDCLRQLRNGLDRPSENSNRK